VDGVLSKRIAISIRPALSTTLPFSSLSARTADRDSLSACDNDSCLLVTICQVLVDSAYYQR